MAEFFRVVLKRYRLAAVICAAFAGLCGFFASQAVPALYPVEAVVMVVEPIAVHRLANPFAPVPSSPHELADVPELLRSRERLVALVKRTGLIDQWDEGRPWLLRLKDQVSEGVRGPVDEKDRLEALVGLLEKRLWVTIEGNKVKIACEWTSSPLALALVQNTMATLMQLRMEREGKTLQDAAEVLDAQYQAVLTEMNERARRMEATLVIPGGWARVEGDRDQLVRDQARAAELLIAAEEKHITAEVFRTSNALRFTVVKPPASPREAGGAGRISRAVVGSLASILAGLVCAAMLGLASGRLLSSAQVTESLGLEVLTSVRLGTRGPWQASRTGLALAACLAIATGAAVGFTKGDLVLSLFPPLAFVGAWLVWTRPLKWPLLALLLVGVTIDDPTDRPYFSLWRSPLYPLGKIFFSNVALFTGFEIAILALTCVMIIRRIWPRDGLDPLSGQAPRPMQVALLVSACTIGVLVGTGLLRGGIFREALWQFRHLLMLPFVAMLLLFALDLPKDLPKLLWVLMGGSLVKALLGTYFMYAIAFPSGAFPPHTTGHNDTMIFVTAVVTALTLFWEKPTRRHLWLLVLWLPLIALALKLNDRRIAYVDIVMTLGLIFVLSPMHEMKRKLVRATIAMLPVLLLYTAVGWNQPNRKIFGPVQKMKSIVAPVENSEEESSNVERDIENFNLMKSWEQNMFLGQGFGHAFTEYLPSNDFRQSAFGHIGHNSILWLLWIGGIVGFTCVLGYLAVGLFFLGRTLRLTFGWRERVGLLVSAGIIVTYLMQAFGDMGTQSVMFDFFVGSALAITGRLATKANAWREVLPSV